jgi:riboflavin kinase/FMN adenylyltransferase
MFDVGTILLEVHLFDYSADLYGRVIDVAFVDWIRPELAFDSVEDLVRRMEEDCRIARSTLARTPDAFPPIASL